MSEVAQSTVRHNFYQSNNEVCISFVLKKLREEDVSIDLSETHLTLKASMPDGSVAVFDHDLFSDVVPDDYTLRVVPVKVELKLKKKKHVHWESVIKPDPEAATPAPRPQRTQKDWDKLSKEVEEEEKKEKPEGEAALQQLFQQIYGDGNEDVKRAMMKSYVESNGTVLSTNWDEVKQKTVETKPPDGCEFKKF